ncbi:MAG: YbaB/EbfC family nucleoid-associated protein [Patescibacteria group bacterium]
MFSKLKQFKDLRDKAKTLQEELGKEIAQGTAGWGKVKVDMNGNQRVVAVHIDQEVMADREKLQTLIAEATNEAIEKIQKVMASKLKDLGGLDLASEFGEMMKK